MSDTVTYLDYNATAPVKPAVAAALAEALEAGGNPSSVHRLGRLARRTVEQARDRVAALAGAAPQAVIFTSGGTEANNLAIAVARGRPLALSAVEHDSVLAAARQAREVALLPVDGEGAVDLEALDQRLAAARPALVSVMLANNETGVVQPLAEIARRVHAAGGLLHCDASQAPGRIDFDIESLGADLLTLSAHKFGGPQGAGALIVREGVAVRPLHRGGGQELGRRAGTENVAAIAGFGVAAELAADDLARRREMAGLRDDVEARLLAVAPAARIFGRGAERLPNTSCVTMPGVRSETQVMALDLAGVAVSAGAACSSGKVAPSQVLRAMGASEAEADSAIRISLGWRTRRKDLDRLIEAWTELYLRTASGGPAAAESAA